MKHIVFIGGHLGYPMDVTPLGGGAMVGLQMARRWARRKDFSLTVLGAGPQAPSLDAPYHRIYPADDLVGLSEFEYARFCREFERASTTYLQDHRAEFSPSETCIVLNDISEGPDIERVAALGYPIVSIWHVDVVDFFNKMYLNNILNPRRLTALFDRLEKFHLGGAVPDLLKLVFQKQRQIVRHSRRLVLPSRSMSDTLRQCYPNVPEDKISIIPWGGWEEFVSDSEVQSEVDRLRCYYQIGPKTRVILTLSRISPEKGLLLLLGALRILETSWNGSAKDICLFLCGEPAFMQGQVYYRKVRAAAQKLKSIRVFFPGYLSAVEKRAYFALSELFISPSIHESYGLSIVEALQSGLPVLASDHSGVEEILTPDFSRVVPYDGRAGGLVRWFGKGGDIPHRLAAELDGLLKNPAQLREMGIAARSAGEKMSFAAASQKVAETALAFIS